MSAQMTQSISGGRIKCADLTKEVGSGTRSKHYQMTCQSMIAQVARLSVKVKKIQTMALTYLVTGTIGCVYHLNYSLFLVILLSNLYFIVMTV